VTVLVIGAAGDAGGRVLRALRDRGAEVRACVRRPEAADELRAGAFETVVADLADPLALDAACEGVSRMFLVSSPGPRQVELESNAIAAAERAGVAHIVKISNLDVPGLTTGLHGNHRAIEARLAASDVVATVLQPSFFATVLSKQVELIRRGRFVLPVGRGRIAWIDARDIAEVAAELLCAAASEDATYRLTGPEALDGAELARRISRVIGVEVVHLDPPREKWRAAVVADGMDRWLADSTVHLYEAVERGALGDVSGDVERLLGRPPYPIDDFLRDELVPALRDAS
jgi:uncharacterized protein YbjT (DUF2867 family)